MQNCIYQHIGKYAKADNNTAIWIVSNSLIIYMILLYLSWITFHPVFIIICSLTRVRIFIIMHDMAHHAFFSSKLANMVGATILGTLVYTSYTGWKKGHDYHHEHSNNIDKQQFAQTAPLTIEAYNKMPTLYRWLYRVIYGHYTLYTITPFIYFNVIQRFFSSWHENLLVLCYLYLLYITGGINMMYIDLITSSLAGSFGVFLFHIQHTFEGAYKARGSDYSRFDNGMQGSSYLIIPWWLAWFTLNIQYHNIHHLNTRVPCYNLKKCFEDGYHLFKNVPTFTLRQALQMLHFSLRSDEKKSFISCYSI
jgi:omega-6 fatty acid desaturase (delta-12 desaturase)